MYKKIIFFIFSFFSSSGIFSRELNMEKKLILHFDVNKTIIAMDRVQNKTIEETINAILAECTFFIWDGQHNQSYHSYVTDKIVQEYPQFSRAGEEFKNKRRELLLGFIDHLKQYPELFVHYEEEKAKMLKVLDAPEMVIFPSFFNLIVWLDKHFKNKYVIYLRTFGTDLPEVMSIIEKKSELKFHGKDEFKGKTFSIAEQNESLFEFFTTQSSKHYGLRDDYAYWKSHDFTSIGGKPFPLDLENSKVITIFFDDNAHDPDRPIICPILRNKELGDTQELIKRGNIVAVNTKEAILDENYFINKIENLLHKVSTNASYIR